MIIIKSAYRNVFAAIMLIVSSGFFMGSVSASTPDNVLVVGQIANPSLDPATVTAVNDFRILMNIMMALCVTKTALLRLNLLLQSWDISADGRLHLQTSLRSSSRMELMLMLILLSLTSIGCLMTNILFTILDHFRLVSFSLPLKKLKL